MTDVVDQATRSRMMSGIRSKDTKPEMLIRKALHAQGFRFRLHVKDLPGKPDLVFPKYNAVIFVHGCFWHGHDCRHFKTPKTRTEFWLEKIEKNRGRDHKNLIQLKASGWRIFLIWECAVRGRKNECLLVESICSWIKSGLVSMEADENGIRPIKTLHASSPDT